MHLTALEGYVMISESDDQRMKYILLLLRKMKLYCDATDSCKDQDMAEDGLGCMIEDNFDSHNTELPSK